MKLRLLILMIVSITALCASIAVKLPVKVIYNPTESVPKGYYLIVDSDIRIGDYVFSKLPAKVKKLAVERQYLPINIPILKPVAAQFGDRICSNGHEIFINDMVIAELLKKDSMGRNLEPWLGCRFLLKGEYFLLSTHSTHSFDSRYFGPVERKMVIGKAVPLWIFEDK